MLSLCLLSLIIYNNVYQCLFLAAFRECFREHFSPQKPIRVQRYELFFENEAFFRGLGVIFKKH